MPTGKQITAARALLGWTMQELASAAGIAYPTLVDFENGNRPSKTGTAKKIQEALEKEGIEFIEGGVRQVTPIYHLLGDKWFLELLADIKSSCADDVIIENVDPRKSGPDVIARLRDLCASGIRFRFTAEEGNTYLLFPVSCYRWVPSDRFKNWVTVIYGDHVAVKTSGNIVGCTVIRDRELAETMKNKFDLVWDLLKPLDIESTAHERIE